MRVVVKAIVVFLLAPAAAWAQATMAGAVRDASGAILPGVGVEAASPALIEKVRTADSSGRYRIEDLRPGTYTVTFTLPGFMTLKRDGLILSGSAVTTVDAELRVGGVSETVTVTGESPVVDVVSTKRELTLDNQTIRNLPSVRSYSYLLTTVPGLQTNNNNVNTGPVFAIFPIHGGRGVESRLTVDGLNISNPPGGNQPPNFVADIGNAQEVTMVTSGGLGESETAGLTMNIVPKQGGNQLSGLALSPASRRGCRPARGRELDPNPTRNLVQVLNLTQTIVPGLVTPMVYRSQSWLNNRTRGSTWNASASYVTGSHSKKFGYRGNSPVQTAFRALATYTVPRIDVLVSSVYQDKPNVGTDQLVSLLANYAQRGRL